MLNVHYTQAGASLASTPEWRATYARLLERVPPGRRNRLERFRNLQAQISSAAALLLLEYAMRNAGEPDFNLKELIDAKDYKPYCPGRRDFNISHSRDTVYCAVIERGRVGVDVEHIRELKSNDFDRMITADELAASGGPAPFFDVWTKKEATLKAQGRSGVWDMHRVQLDFERECANFKGERWRLHALPAPSGYVASLACPTDVTPAVNCEPVDINRLLIA